MNPIRETPQGDEARASRRRFLQRTAALAASALALRPAGLAADGPFVEQPCNVVRLACGRRLAYAEYGDPAGRQTVFLFHGTPSCRHEAVVFLAALRARPGVRLLAPDRPGFGRSDPDPAGTFHTWACDVAALADTLGVGRFGVVAVSGGTPYALATARAWPERVTAVSLGCPMAPLEAADTAGSVGARGARLALHHPVLATLALNRLANGLRRHPHRIPGEVFFGPAERAFLAHPEVRPVYVSGTLEGLSQGAAEVARVAGHLAHPWACWLKDVRPRVSILQGCCDQITTPAIARDLAAMLPRAELRYAPGEGHVSLIWRRALDLLAAAL